MLKREGRRWMETDRCLMIFFQHLDPAMPETHMDIIVSKFTYYIWPLKLLTEKFLPSFYLA